MTQIALPEKLAGVFGPTATAHRPSGSEALAVSPSSLDWKAVFNFLHPKLWNLRSRDRDLAERAIAAFIKYLSRCALSILRGQGTRSEGAGVLAVQIAHDFILEVMNCEEGRDLRRLARKMGSSNRLRRYFTQRARERYNEVRRERREEKILSDAPLEEDATESPDPYNPTVQGEADREKEARKLRAMELLGQLEEETQLLVLQKLDLVSRPAEARDSTGPLYKRMAKRAERAYKWMRSRMSKGNSKEG